MRKINILSGIAVAVLFSMASCDVIEGPYTEGNALDTALCPPKNFMVKEQHTRKILLEDFTGHTCGNCPNAAETAHELEITYGEQIVIMAVHVGFFAEPYPDPNGEFGTDYRTEVGDDLDEAFGPSAAGLPRGMVNRKPVSGSPVLAHTAWWGIVQGIVNDAPSADIQILTNYDEATRTACADVQVEVLTSISEELKVCVFLTEDSIVDWQKDYGASPSDIPDYVHRHALRASFNGTWGVAMDTAPYNSGDLDTLRYSMVLDSAWSAPHCSVVAFVYNASSLEVLQAEEVHLE